MSSITSLQWTRSRNTPSWSRDKLWLLHVCVCGWHLMPDPNKVSVKLFESCWWLKKALYYCYYLLSKLIEVEIWQYSPIFLEIERSVEVKNETEERTPIMGESHTVIDHLAKFFTFIVFVATATNYSYYWVSGNNSNHCVYFTTERNSFLQEVLSSEAIEQHLKINNFRKTQGCFIHTRENICTHTHTQTTTGRGK